MIHATNAIESYNSALRKYAKNKRSFVSNEALAKLLYTGRARYDVDPETVPGRSSERAAHGCVAHMSGTDDQAVSVRTQFGNELPKIIRQSRFASS